MAEAHSNRKTLQPYLSEGAVHSRHTRVLFGTAMRRVLCGATDPEPGVRLPVSFTCQNCEKLEPAESNWVKVMYLIIS